MKELLFSVGIDIISELDYFGLELVHNVAIKGSPILRNLSLFFTYAGEKCVLLLFIALCLCISKKTRKYGLCIIFSVALAYIINNMIVKNIIMRPRPYIANKTFYDWFVEMGAKYKSSSSFPSGHVAGASAALFSISFYKKQMLYYILAIVVCVLTAYSRLYFVVHYPTDCIVGFLEGILVGFVGYLLTKKLWRFMKNNKNNNKFFNYMITKP